MNVRIIHNRTQIFIIMLKSNNSVQLVGHLGKDVVLTAFENGNKKATAIIATNDFYTSRTGEKVKNTAWHKIIAWGKTAESLASNVQKGAEIAIHGKLTYRTFTDTQGHTKYVTEVVVSEFFKLAKVNTNTVEARPF